MATDFEAEGLLDEVDTDEGREARLELLRRLEEEGVELDELRQATEEGRLALLPVERVLAGKGERCTREDVAERSGLDEDFLVKVWRALGMPEPEPGKSMFNDEDVEAAKAIKRFRDAGISDDELLELARAMSQSVASVAAAVGPAFAQALLEPGDTESRVALRYADGSRELIPLLDRAITHVLHLHLRERARTTVIGDAELATGSMPNAQTMGICFADLVGFTKLGERVPSEELGSVAGRLAELAAEVAEPPVRMVKTIGDAAMLVSDDPDCLLTAALRLVDAAENEDQRFPSVHAGLALGETLPRSGDYYGRPVNLASRITDFAVPGSVVADSEIHDAASGDYRWSHIGKRRLKGIKGQVELYRVRPADQSSDGAG
jgi:adenylate cyclase